ncbi:hypothetical protein DICVIV_13117 [Dictyocaulus viviparus]|uniref:Sodium:neurotransmitter symporter family protein n=1 Tax=Dictyocaulus viviparus TaxID=29172 RepID=A0A0D8X8M1_DICVI|nr:hypothetical protein DICVIV_13117 [Dictyocaulus viviparus]
MLDLSLFFSARHRIYARRATQKNSKGINSDGLESPTEMTKLSTETTKTSLSVESAEKRKAREHTKRAKVDDETSAANCSDQDESSSICSEELLVVETEENQNYLRKVTIGLLSRAGFREQYWTNKSAAYSVMLSYLITYDTIAMLFLYIQRFGVYFLFNYSVCMLLVGFPVCYLEMALGQYTSTGVYLVYDRMVPGFVGIALSALMVNFLTICVNHSIFINTLTLLLNTGIGSSTKIPWNNCIKDGDDKACYAYPLHCQSKRYYKDLPIFPEELTFSNSTQTKLLFREIEDFKGWRRTDYPSFDHLLITAVASFILIYILTRNKRWIVKFLKFAFLITTFVLPLLLNGFLVYFKPNYSFYRAMSMKWTESVNNFTAWACAVDLVN